MNLSDARREFLNALPEGVVCPCCDRYSKIYKRKLNANMVQFLISLYRAFVHKKDWIHYSECRFQGRDYNYLTLWGLIVPMPNDDPAKKTSGYWKPTKRAGKFLRGQVQVPQYVFHYGKSVQDYSTSTVTVREALGKPFNYEELMG